MDYIDLDKEKWIKAQRIKTLQLRRKIIDYAHFVNEGDEVYLDSETCVALIQLLEDYFSILKHNEKL